MPEQPASAATRIGSVFHALIVGLALTCGTPAALAGTVAIVISDETGKPLHDAVIALWPSSGSMPPLAVPPTVTIDQINKEFQPHVTAIRSGSLVEFPNSDNIRHQVYSFSEAKSFETKLYAGRTAPPVLFDKPGVVVLGCNIHDGMQAYVYVLDTPYFATTDAAGHAAATTPAGHYKIKIWHPLYEHGREPLIREYEVGDSEQQFSQTLTLDADDVDASLPRHALRH